MLLEQIALLILGIVLMIAGFCFMAWGVTQTKDTSKARLADLSDMDKILKAFGDLVDTIAKHVPNAATGLGLLMMIVGLFLIVFTFIIPVIPNLLVGNTTAT
jgi:O-antigen ligase